MASLDEAVADLYRVAVVDRRTTSTKRLNLLAAYIIGQLDQRGLPGAEAEVRIPGGGRPKTWDVGWQAHGKYRMAISLKSILQNLPGTVPNRIDDLMGELANVQLYSPEIVVGYVMIFDVGQDTRNARGQTWCDTLVDRLGRLAVRRAPHWSVGTLEAAAVLRVDFREGPRIAGGQAALAAALDILVREVRERNPDV